LSPATRDLKDRWKASEEFCRDVIKLALWPDAVRLCGGAEGWRVLRSVAERAAEEREYRFECWQDAEAREVAALREELAILDSRVNELRAEIAGRATR
jgi:hypothetical protein